MWLKGFFILSSALLVNSALIMLEGLIGYEIHWVIYNIPAACACAAMANVDYYKHVVCEERFWPSLPKALASIWGQLVYFAGAIFIVLVSAMAVSKLPTCDNGQAIGMVDELVMKELSKSLPAHLLSKVSVNIHSPTLFAGSEEAGGYICVAKIETRTNGQPAKIYPVTYTIQPAESGGFVVNVTEM